MTIRESIKGITTHPYTTFFWAVILIGTSITEAWETIGEDFSEANFGAHHGVMLFGVVTLIGVIPDLLEGIERLAGEEKSEA